LPGIACGGECVIAFAGAGLGAGAGGGGLVCCAGLDGGDLRGRIGAQLLERGGRGPGGLLLVARGVLCGGGVFAGRGEGFGESVCLFAGFGGLGLGGDGGGLGAAAGGCGVGDLGADTSGVQAGGLLAGSYVRPWAARTIIVWAASTLVPISASLNAMAWCWAIGLPKVSRCWA